MEGRKVPDGQASGSRRPLVAWVLFDAAMILYAINITSIAFPLWVVDDAGGSDGNVGLALGIGMAIVFLLAPVVGALCDRRGQRVRILTLFISACVALTLGLGHGSLTLSLTLFALAVAAHGCTFVCYDALLPLVSTPETRGRVSGYGVAAGFAGALGGILVGLLVLAAGGDRPLTFKLTALLLALSLIPMLLWIREPRTGASEPSLTAVSQAVVDAVKLPGRARQWPGMARFMIGRYFYTDAANTIFAFMAIYATKEIGYSDVQAQLVLLSGILAGPIGALSAGPIADRIGPKRTLDGLLLLWIGVLTLCAAIPAFALPDALFWLVAPLGGVAFGGTGATDRALLLRLTPPDRVGEGFGIFAMVGRFSAIGGPLLWSAQADWLGWGRPAAVFTLALMVLLAFIIYRRLTDVPREWEAPPALDLAPA